MILAPVRREARSELNSRSSNRVDLLQLAAN